MSLLRDGALGWAGRPRRTACRAGLWIAVAALASAGCGASNSEVGAPATGGSNANGGGGASTGGSSAAGAGGNGIGGSASTGGNAGTDGSMGTGGSAGSSYLKLTLGKRFFPELWEARTLLTE